MLIFERVDGLGERTSDQLVAALTRRTIVIGDDYDATAHLQLDAWSCTRVGVGRCRTVIVAVRVRQCAPSRTVS